MIISFIIVQITAISVLAYCLLTERKYCKHLYWWSDIAACLIFIPCLIPIFGIFISLAGIIDCIRNIKQNSICKLDAEDKLYEYKNYNISEEAYKEISDVLDKYKIPYTAAHFETRDKSTKYGNITLHDLHIQINLVVPDYFNEI